MSAAQIAGWTGTVIVLGGYAVSVHLARPFIFHGANVIGVFGTAWSAFAAHAWPNLALTLAFGVIAASAFRNPRSST